MASWLGEDQFRTSVRSSSFTRRDSSTEVSPHIGQMPYFCLRYRPGAIAECLVAARPAAPVKFQLPLGRGGVPLQYVH